MLALLVVAVAGADPLGAAFAEWMAQHNQAYPTEEETQRRFDTYKQNKAYIEAHNAEASRGEHSFTLAMNKFGAMDAAEYRQTLLGFRAKGQRGVAAAELSGPAPDSWDWRPKGVVTAVKNQAQCGSCWAFSAVATMEGAFNLAANGSVPAACKGTTCGPHDTPCCSFSEQELVDCVNHGQDNCNKGGEMHDGVLEIAKQQGGKLETEKEYPYTSGGGTSSGVCHAQGGVQTGISGYTQVAANEDALKVAAYSKPILSIGIDASQNSFQFYASGVYDEPKCKNKVDELDHGVAIVGWGEEAGKPYWIIRNSWGPSWGEDGYYRIIRNKGKCGLNTMVTSAEVSKSSIFV